MAGKHWDDFTETRIIEAKKWLYITLCSFRGILFTPNLLVLFFPLACLTGGSSNLQHDSFVLGLAFAFQNYYSLARGRLFLGTFPVKLLLKLCWEQLALFSFGLCVRICLLASTKDVQIFTDVTVLFSLPECFTSGYWKVGCLFVMLFTTCYIMGCGGVLFKSRDISVTEVSLLVQFLSIITEAWPFYNKWWK